TATLLSDGRLLVAGGFFSDADGHAALAGAEIYDPLSSSWASPPPLGVARHYHTAALLPDGRLLVAGGYTIDNNNINVDGTTLASAEIYDPLTNGWAIVPPMSAARHLHTANLLPDGRVLIAGGLTNNSGTALASAETYNFL